MICNSTLYYLLSCKGMMFIILFEVFDTYLHRSIKQTDMNNTIKIASDLLAIAVIIAGGFLIKPVTNWLLVQLYKIFIGSGYFK